MVTLHVNLSKPIQLTPTTKDIEDDLFDCDSRYSTSTRINPDIRYVPTSKVSGWLRLRFAPKDPQDWYWEGNLRTS